MKITRKIQETKEVDQVVDILCNQCGLTCMKGDHGHADPYGLVEATVSCGYYSEALPDLTRYTFSICEECLKRMFDRFKIPPTCFDQYSGEFEYDSGWKQKSETALQESNAKRSKMVSWYLSKRPCGTEWISHGVDAGTAGFSSESGINVQVTAQGHEMWVSASRESEVPLLPDEIDRVRRAFCPIPSSTYSSRSTGNAVLFVVHSE